MIVRFSPENNEVIFIQNCTVFHILKGVGSLEIDFQKYFNWDDKLIYLERGQYIKFLAPNFLVQKVEFPSQMIRATKSARVLFKHITSVSSVCYGACKPCQQVLTEDSISSNRKSLLEVSIRHWFQENPFKAKPEEYRLIYDIKEMVDENFRNQIKVAEILNGFTKSRPFIHKLLESKIGISIKGLFEMKRLIESKKQLAFTDKSIKQISYDLGYTEPSYFCRAFKRNTGRTPGQFRNQMNFDRNDGFIDELYFLIRKYHTTQRKIGFYAEKMALSERSLSRKVREELNDPLGKIIRIELIRTAKNLLHETQSVKETAMALSFREANHFSSFFKRYTKFTPQEFLKIKKSYD